MIRARRSPLSWTLALTELLLLLACAPAPAAGRIEGRTFLLPGADLALQWPGGWTIVVDPKLFRAEIPDTVLEGKHGDTLVALSFHPMPGAEALALDSALDGLMMRWPSPDSAKGAGYALQRLPWCGGAIEQLQRGEDGRTFARYAWAARDGLAVLSAWSPSGEPDRRRLRALVCGRPD